MTGNETGLTFQLVTNYGSILLLSQIVFEAIIPGWFPGVGQWPGDHYGKDSFLSSQILTTGRNMWIAEPSKADIVGDPYLSPSSPSSPTGNSPSVLSCRKRTWWCTILDCVWQRGLYGWSDLVHFESGMLH